jgi:hypothetical protein
MDASNVDGSGFLELDAYSELNDRPKHAVFDVTWIFCTCFCRSACSHGKVLVAISVASALP